MSELIFDGSMSPSEMIKKMMGISEALRMSKDARELVEENITELEAEVSQYDDDIRDAQQWKAEAEREIYRLKALLQYESTNNSSMDDGERIPADDQREVPVNVKVQPGSIGLPYWSPNDQQSSGSDRRVFPAAGGSLTG